MITITFSDQPIHSTALFKTAKENEVSLKVLGNEEPWVSNGYKLYLLNNFLQYVDPEEVILIVDAFDVIFTTSSKKIEEAFNRLSCDILFSAEANLYLGGRKHYNQYLRKYPGSPTPFRFLNSGSYIGKAAAIVNYLTSATKNYNLDIKKQSDFRNLKSDQTILSRYYVDRIKANDLQLNVKLDHKQQIFGCAGGRVSACKFKFLSQTHSYHFYRTERMLLRKLALTNFQYRLWDFVYVGSGQYSNMVTNTKPGILHLPGSKKDFDDRLNFLQNQQRPKLSLIKKIVAYTVSLYAFFVSSVRSLF